MENSQEFKKCRLCGNDLANQPWHSEWDGPQHYKTNLCNKCGKKTWVKVNFEGSGHDEWKLGQEE